MLKPLAEPEKNLIVKNVMAACYDITKLNPKGYDFLHLSIGFIAHYNLRGFCDYYKTPGHLTGDILKFQDMNQWDNFKHWEKDYAFCMAKKDVYNRICAAIEDALTPKVFVVPTPEHTAPNPAQQQMFLELTA